MKAPLLYTSLCIQFFTTASTKANLHSFRTLTKCARTDTCGFTNSYLTNRRSVTSSYRNRHVNIHQMSTATSNKSCDQDGLIFGRFRIDKSQIFYRSPNTLSAAIVNLRPIVPGHVLVISKRIVPTISELSSEEYADLWSTVRYVQDNILSKCYPDTEGYNIAIQDGAAAGQSVPHVHVHILPRKGGDFEVNDDVYQELQDWAPKSPKVSGDTKDGGNKLHVPSDEERRDRTLEEMDAESQMYRDIVVG